MHPQPHPHTLTGPKPEILQPITVVNWQIFPDWEAHRAARKEQSFVCDQGACAQAGV